MEKMTLTEPLNFYEILNVKETATDKQIKKAYRKKVQAHHPDRNPADPESEDKIKSINQAYEVLIHPNKRRDYDRKRIPFPQGSTFQSSSQNRARRTWRFPSNSDGEPYIPRFSKDRDKIERFKVSQEVQRDSSVEGYYNEGVAFERIGRWPEAKQAYESALEIAPCFGKAHMGLGKVYDHMDKAQNALYHMNLAAVHFKKNGDHKRLIETKDRLRNFKEKYSEA